MKTMMLTCLQSLLLYPNQENMSKYQTKETRMLSSRVSRRPTSPTAEDLGRIISASVLLP